MELKTFLDEIQTPTAKMSVKQLREREEMWRTIWDWIDETVKRYLMAVGLLYRIQKRDYKSVIGELGACKFELVELELAVYETFRDYRISKDITERKVVKMPKSAIMLEEVIYDRLEEDEQAPDVSGLDELEAQMAEKGGDALA